MTPCTLEVVVQEHPIRVSVENHCRASWASVAKDHSASYLPLATDAWLHTMTDLVMGIAALRRMPLSVLSCL